MKERDRFQLKKQLPIKDIISNKRDRFQLKRPFSIKGTVYN